MSDIKKVLVFGISNITPVIIEYFHDSPRFKIVGVLTNVEKMFPSEYEGLKVYDYKNIENHFNPKDVFIHIVTPMSDNNHRKEKENLSHYFKQKSFSLISYIHPNAYVAKSATIGENCFISNGAIVEPFAQIGDGVHVRSAAYISHHTVVGKYSFVAPRAATAGKVKIGDYCFIGVNATIRDNVTIGDECIVGGGAIVQKNLQDKSVIKAARSILLDKRSTDFNI